MDEKTLCVGIVGAGAISDIYLQNLSGTFRNLRLKAIADINMEIARRRAEAYGIQALTVEELLSDPEIDIVVNLTPVFAHYEVIKNALLHGKHVYTEKTITDSLEKSAELVALARERGLYFGSAPDTFLGAALQTARAAVDAGILGEINSFAISVNRCNDLLIPYFDILRQPGGGVLLDYGVYYITALVSLLGPVAQVGSVVRAPYQTHWNCNPRSPLYGRMMDTPNESQVSAVIRMESGVTGTLHMDTETVLEDQAFFVLYGTRGMLYLTDPNQFGGSLKPEYRAFWADYICRYILEFRNRGFEVQRISLQNEPKAVQTWDSCVYTAGEEKEFLRDFIYPALRKHDLQDVEVFIWDHNKERVYERVRDILDETTKDMVAGVAFHWYSGDHFEALDLVRRQYPDLKMVVSESCIEYTKFGAADGVANAGRLSHEIIGDLNGGMCAFYDWNLLLDETGGPNHVGNLCHAPFLYDRQKRELLPQLIQKHFYHFAHYIEPGARRIGFSKYTDKLDVTAFQNPDGRIVTVILNRSEETLPVELRLREQIVRLQIEGQSICTGVIG